MTDRRGGRMSRESGRKRSIRPSLEGLEGRALLAATLRPAPVVDVSRLAGNQSDVSIAINPTNPNCIVTMARNDAGPGLVTSRSIDGGATWTTQVVADGYGVMVPASRDPNLAFDDAGHLYATYVDFTNQGIQIALSTDCGASFKCIATFTSPDRDADVVETPQPVDRPAIATGDGTVWVTYRTGLTPITGDARNDAMALGGIVVDAAGKVAATIPTRLVPPDSRFLLDGPLEVNYGSVAVSPAGVPIIAYQDQVDLAGSSVIYTSRFDPTSRSLTTARPTTFTTVGGQFYIPAEPTGHIDAEVGLAYDLSDGRLYMVYTGSPAINCGCTYVDLRFSDDDGATWSNPTRVSDNLIDSANFNPKVAVDPVTGHVAVSFYSARNDFDSGAGDRDDKTNDDVELFASVSTDGGLSFAPNVQVATAPTSAAIAGGNGGRDLGRYTGLAIYNDVMYPAWADNSVGLAGNPTPNDLDVAVSRVQVLFLTAQGVALNVLEDTPFLAQVATLTDTAPGAANRMAADFDAFIDWGDGESSAGTVVSLGGPRYGVIGSHTYQASGFFQITVTVTNRSNGRSDVASSTADVANIAVPLTGRLDPASDTGASSTDAITSNNRPTFLGTTLPGGTVQVFAQAFGSIDLIPIGRSIAGPDGTWAVTSSPLADGTYAIYAIATEPVGGTTATITILPNPTIGFLVLDTVGPKVEALDFAPTSSRAQVTFRDGLAGLDPAGLTARLNYQLSRGGSTPLPIASLDASPAGAATDARSVDLIFGGGRLRGTDYLFRVVATGVLDLAGNPLDGDFFGYFPSGDAASGGDFLARLDSIHGTVFPAESISPVVTASRTAGRTRRDLGSMPIRTSGGPRPRGPVRLRHRP